MVALDLGAPGERLRAYTNGQVLPYASAEAPTTLNDQLLTTDISAGVELSMPIKAGEYEDTMQDYYALTAVARPY